MYNKYLQTVYTKRYKKINYVIMSVTHAGCGNISLA